MADTKVDYLVDDDGKVVTSAPEDTQLNLATGMVPAGAKQIEDFKKEEAFHAKYGTPGQQAKTFAESAGSGLTLGLSRVAESALLHNQEEQRSRAEENPGVKLAGTVASVAAPIAYTALTGGAAAPAAAAELAGEGAEAAGAAAPGILTQAADAAAPSLISKAGEAAREGVTGLLGEPTTALGRVLTKGAGSAAAGLTEGTAYGVGQVVDEAAMGDPHLTASNALEEVGLSGLLGGGIGGTGSLLSGLIGESAGGQLGQKLEEWAHRFEGNRNLSAATGGANAQSLLKAEVKKIGLEGVNQLGREGGDMGLVSMFSTPGETLAKSEEAMGRAGSRMGDIAQAADAAGEEAKPSAARVVARARAEVLRPLQENPLEAGTARQFGEILDGYTERLGADNPENKLGFKQLHDLRKQVSDKLFGLRGVADPEATALKSSLHDFRSILSEEINSGLEKAKLPEASVEAWKQANRQYQVAATFSKFAEHGLVAARGNNILPLTTVMSALAGHMTGGLLGGATMGAAAYGAKRFGSGILGAGARGVRRLIDEGAAEGLASKTAEAISAGREAAMGEGAATRAQALWNRIGEGLGEPVGGPTKDLLRDVAQEKLAEKEASTPIETVAALSQLEASNQRAKERVGKLAKSVVTGKLAHAAAGVAGAHSAHEMTQHMERVHQLAQNPDMLLQHLGQQTADLQQHAPNTAMAVSTVSSRAVSYLHAKFPPPVKATPLSPTPAPHKQQLWEYNQAREGIEKPSTILRDASSGRLTPQKLQAVASVHPEALAGMKQAVLEEAAGAGRVPHQSRLMLSMLLGRPMDSSMVPASLASAQAIFRMPSAKPMDSQTGPAAMGKPTATGMGKLKLSSNIRLPGQAAESRRGGE